MRLLYFLQQRVKTERMFSRELKANGKAKRIAVGAQDPPSSSYQWIAEKEESGSTLSQSD
jgi:hypothetical protein